MKPRIIRSCLACCLLPLAVARASGPGPETQTLFLSGHDNDDAVAWDFTCDRGMRAGEKARIAVPSNWELQGFGQFSYGTEHRIKGGVGPIARVEGRYHTTFTAPAAWAGRRTFLVFEGVMTDTRALIDGAAAGPKHQGGFVRFKYDVSGLVKTGRKQSLEVIVDDESSEASINAAERRGDYYNYGGIYRPVYLESVPSAYIDRVAIDAKADGVFGADIAADGALPGDGLEGRIFDAQGAPAGAVFRAQVGESGRGRLETRVDRPRQWTAETPNLYVCQIDLRRHGELVHRVRQRFGFRTIEVRAGAGIYLNGRRILLKGSDRHTFWPDSGRCSSPAISRQDIRLMREMNMNAVRLSHYPPDQHFLDACDEIGLYALDELPGWHSSYDDEAGHRLVREMVIRDVNHPSILFWDNGNEGGWNVHLDDDFGRVDPQGRRVLHPSRLSMGIETRHYSDYAKFKEYAAGPAIFFPTEFLHGLYDGGAGAGLQDYWDVVRHSKVAGGGFIWAFLDEAPKRVDLDGRLDTRGNRAPDGIVGPYREKEGSFYSIRQLWCPIAIISRTIPADGRVEVENRFDFTNLRDCRFSYEVRRFAAPDDARAGYSVVSAGGVASPEVEPGGKGILKLPPPGQWREGDAVALRLTDTRGETLLTPVFALSQLDRYRAVARQAGGTAVASLQDAAGRLIVKSGALELEFSKETGYLLGAVCAGRRYPLSDGPRLVKGEAKLIKIGEAGAPAGDTAARVVAEYSGNLRDVTWEIRRNGWVSVTCRYRLSGPADYAGIGFNYPEASVKSLRWLGDGPYRVYQNRIAGPTLGVWETAYNDSVTGAIPWKYPEFKGYFGQVRWAKYAMAEGPLTFLTGENGLYLQNFRPSVPAKDLVRYAEAPYPSTSIGFLTIIPPIGTKFAPAATLGPMSQPGRAEGDGQISLSIRFGDAKDGS